MGSAGSLYPHSIKGVVVRSICYSLLLLALSAVAREHKITSSPSLSSSCRRRRRHVVVTSSSSCRHASPSHSVIAVVVDVVSAVLIGTTAVAAGDPPGWRRRLRRGGAHARFDKLRLGGGGLSRLLPWPVGGRPRRGSESCRCLWRGVVNGRVVAGAFFLHKAEL